MIKCKYCGTDLPNDCQFCSTCGAKTEKIPVAEGVVANSTQPQNQSATNSRRSIRGGMLAWSIVNISAGLLSCCCFVPFVSLVLGVIALVYTLLATDCPTDKLEKDKIRTARILNIIASCITVLSVVVYMVLILIGLLASGDLDNLMRYYYYFD